MQLKTFYSTKHLLLAVISLLLFTTTQDISAKDKLIKYLEESSTYSDYVIPNGALLKISNAQIFSANFVFNLENNDWGGVAFTKYFIKTPAALIPFNSVENLLESKDFVAAFKSNFALNNDDDAILFQTMLNAFDKNHNNKGYVRSDNKWFFVRDKFFDFSLVVYIVTTDEKGKITEIKYSNDTDLEIPEETINAGEYVEIDFEDNYSISLKESEIMKNEILSNIDYRFEAEERNLELLPKISNASLIIGKLIINEHDVEHDYTSESTYQTFVLKYNDDYERAASSKDLLISELFAKSIKKEFKLNKNNAALFETFIEEMLGEPKTIDKNPYNEKNIWFFPRSLSAFDEITQGILVATDDNSNIKSIDFNDFSEISVLRLMMKDPDFVADYAFKMKEPKSSIIKHKAGKPFYISISFNDKIASASGAWILTRFNGEKVGLLAGTTITSPFTDEVPAEVLTIGKHLLEYLLLSPGEDTDKSLGHVKIEIEVE